jgi:hypothetical protein
VRLTAARESNTRRYEPALPGNKFALIRIGVERSGASRAQVAWGCNVGFCVIGKPGPISVPGASF